MKITKKRHIMIRRHAKKYTGAFIVGGACVTISYLVSLFLPLNLQYLIDQIMLQQKDNLIFPVMCTFLALSIINIVASYIHHKTRSEERRVGKECAP